MERLMLLNCEGRELCDVLIYYSNPNLARPLLGISIQSALFYSLKKSKRAKKHCFNNKIKKNKLGMW